MRWLDSFTDSMDMNLSKLWEIVKDRKASYTAVLGVAKSQIQLSNWSTKMFIMCDRWHKSSHVKMWMKSKVWKGMDFRCGLIRLTWWYYILITDISFLHIGASLVVQRLKRLPAVWETRVRSLGREDPLEKEMATHSSILAWRIPWMEELGGPQSMGRKESDTTERLHFHFHFLHTRSNLKP